MLQSRVEKATLWFEKSHNANSEQALLHAYLASICTLKRETQRAKSELDQAHRSRGDDRYSSIARLTSAGSFGVPKVRAVFETTSFAGLRKAGVPAEAHIFANGSHGSGLGKGDAALDQWPNLLETWLRAQGLLTRDESVAGPKPAWMK